MNARVFTGALKRTAPSRAKPLETQNATKRRQAPTAEPLLEDWGKHTTTRYEKFGS